MKKFSILVAVVVLTMSMVTGCRGEAKEVRTYTDPEQAINISVKEEFVISPKVASGFMWQLDYNTTMLKLVDWGFEWIDIGEQEVVGTSWFKFKALKKTDETQIIMICGWYLDLDCEAFWQEFDKKVFTVNIR